MRILYHVPIIHLESFTMLDSETLSIIEKKIGKAELDFLRNEHQKFWEVVRIEVRKNIPVFKNIIIYCESFPATERTKIQKFFDLLIENNPNHPQHLLIKELISEGAVLEGLEDINLVAATGNFYLKRAGDITRDISDGKKIFNDPEIVELMQRRDEFIARRINNTLPINGAGILFIGKDHGVVEELDKLEESGQLLSPMKVIYL